MISSKHYAKHIIEPYFALETIHSDSTDLDQVCSCISILFRSSSFQIEQLKQMIEQTALAESYIGEQIPTRWLEFENDLNRLKKQQDTFYASLDQVPISLFLVISLYIPFSRSVKSLECKTFALRMN